MKSFIAKIGFVVLLAFAASRGFSGEVVDRLVASVDNVPILESDWNHAVALEALEQGRAIGSYSGDERRPVLDRLVDQQLIRSQMGDENIAAAEERDIAKQLEKIREQYPAAKSDEDWQHLLAQYGITEEMLRLKVARQLQVMRFVDLRLRPETRVARQDVETYYTENLVPEVRSRNAREASLAEVYAKIEEILRQQRIDALLTAWLQELRDHSDIQWLGVQPNVATPSEDSVATSGGR
jgi:hypothetical protein